jgi:hypothetical protein
VGRTRGFPGVAPVSGRRGSDAIPRCIQRRHLPAARPLTRTAIHEPRCRGLTDGRRRPWGARSRLWAATTLRTVASEWDRLPLLAPVVHPARRRSVAAAHSGGGSVGNGPVAGHPDS